MIAPAPTKEIIKQLKAAGFNQRDGKGSHTNWTCAHGKYVIPVPTGHRTISPGVRRKIDNAIHACETTCEEE